MTVVEMMMLIEDMSDNECKLFSKLLRDNMEVK